MRQPKNVGVDPVSTAQQNPPSKSEAYPTLHARILAELREDILSGSLSEGTQLRQDQLAARYGASRIPIREALVQLEGEGLVRQQVNRGYTVTTLSMSEISEEFDLRAMIEADLISRSIPHLKRSHIREARQISDRLEGNIGEVIEPREWGKLNWQFHCILLEPARRKRTMRILKNLHQSSARYVRMHMSLTAATKVASELDHRRILQACIDRNTHEASREMSEHILKARDELMAFLADRRRD